MNSTKFGTEGLLADLIIGDNFLANGLGVLILWRVKFCHFTISRLLRLTQCWHHSAACDKWCEITPQRKIRAKTNSNKTSTQVHNHYQQRITWVGSWPLHSPARSRNAYGSDGFVMNSFQPSLSALRTH